MPGWIPSLGNERGHWSRNFGIKRDWKDKVWATASNARRDARWERPSKEDRTRLVVISMARPHLLDIDNLYRTAKPVLDGLKGVLIYDDKPRWADVQVRQERVAGTKAKITVEVWL